MKECRAKSYLSESFSTRSSEYGFRMEGECARAGRLLACVLHAFCESTFTPNMEEIIETQCMIKMLRHWVVTSQASITSSVTTTLCEQMSLSDPHNGIHFSANSGAGSSEATK